ncbi:hypothetical protein [Mycobacterium sp. IDR2000157661]|uniref:hypothetical protein n=1 Tax=Mycobacterium sp. IDR2000157661 TaxID=2867005 RepID=UPI001EEA3668|nr:hypothetical protein [Mycobacterium sp. IDR2000157661]ULE32175.1 hypothetical protein K3G64_18770 [Mycobacterium sp. IDR2000157661]
MNTTDTTTGTDTTDSADAAAVEPQPAVPDETASVDTEGAETADASPEGASEVDEDQDDTDDDGASAGDGPGREAAKYRRRLRDVEAERDTLKATVAALQRAEVARLAADAGLRPAALWASGPELADLLGEDGTVNADAVAAAVAVAREQLGIPKPRPRGNVVRGEGRTVGRPAKPSGLNAMVALVQGRDGSDG